MDLLKTLIKKIIKLQNSLSSKVSEKMFRKKGYFVFFVILLLFTTTKIYPPVLKLIAPQKPVISLNLLKEEEIVSGDKLYVKGHVRPNNSEVKVNGQFVAQNGDGSFTAVVSIPEGKSALKIEAVYRGKESEITRLVTRQLTQEELLAKAEIKKAEDLEARQKVLGVDKKIDDLLSAYTNGVNLSAVEVLDHKLEEKSGLKRVVGKVINNTYENVYWVKVTATFYDLNNNPVDSKSGFAASMEEFMSPGKVSNFVTQSTTKDFDYYKVNVDWKTNSTVSMPLEPANKEATATPKLEVY